VILLVVVLSVLVLVVVDSTLLRHGNLFRLVAVLTKYHQFSSHH